MFANRWQLTVRKALQPHDNLARAPGLRSGWCVAGWVTLGLLICQLGCGSGAMPKAAGQAPAVAPQEPSAPATLQPEEPPQGYPFKRYVPAAELDGGLAWFNTTDGQPVKLESLRGKFVILDFWTYCCINCMHILPELAKLEAKYPGQLVVIGVHTAKFDTEQDSENIREAIARYGIQHPVVNDAEQQIWNRYFVNSWPSLRIIDPLGNLVVANSGEITADVISGFLDEHLPFYRERKLLNEQPFVYTPTEVEPATGLKFPGKVLADATGNRLFIADSNHQRIVVTDLTGKQLDVIGTGHVGKQDGGYSEASFNHPQGMALQDSFLWVADTENHLLRKVDLQARQVLTVAGTGEQGRGPWPGMTDDGTLPARFVGPPLTTPLNSPWDLWVHQGELFIAMAGPHQIWKLNAAATEIGPYAGNGREDIVDGPLLPPTPYERGFSSFAQPSGLSSDGTVLYVADSEGSSIRAVPLDPTQPVTTVLGTAHLDEARLFTFGDQDGSVDQAMLQHALGVAYQDQRLWLTDTYNSKLKVLDLRQQTVTTVAGGTDKEADGLPALNEPAGLSWGGALLYIADTNAHRIRVYDPATKKLSTLELQGVAAPPKKNPSTSPAAPTTEASATH